MLTERIRNAYTLFKGWIKTMGIREMGRYWSTKERRKISTMREKQRLKEEVSKMRPLAKATRMTKGQKVSAVKRKRSAGNPGGKPTNVKTFA